MTASDQNRPNTPENARIRRMPWPMCFAQAIPSGLTGTQVFRWYHRNQEGEMLRLIIPNSQRLAGLQLAELEIDDRPASLGVIDPATPDGIPLREPLARGSRVRLTFHNNGILVLPPPKAAAIIAVPPLSPDRIYCMDCRCLNWFPATALPADLFTEILALPDGWTLQPYHINPDPNFGWLWCPDHPVTGQAVCAEQHAWATPATMIDGQAEPALPSCPICHRGYSGCTLDLAHLGTNAGA